MLFADLLLSGYNYSYSAPKLFKKRPKVKRGNHHSQYLY